ncbi:VOC family protein [Nodosilinea sp. LEGE 07088]|uniref:VOC family protein n=1 Tax=Nodosilinea sp. LEGE 07088 TaxID=2777968 RepID=UPI0018825D5A|nr:VOC family protein [Nodosilinea sp. LEGE 07088]MBE9138224.1 VOC family protein [Nodosilinea sp. LEGE 07088]
MNNNLFSKMAFLYVGSADFEADFEFYRNVLGAQLVWGFDRFGAKVAAFKLGDSPLILIADHLSAPSIMPIFAVDDLSNVVATLTAKGWQAERGPMEMPNGTCYVFHDPSGNRYGIFEDVRPFAMEKAYQDPTNTHRIF